MRKLDNKKSKMLMKQSFTKDELLKYKKYDRLMSYNIPYAVINRAYKRYIERLEDYILYGGYLSHWYKKDRVSFCNSVKIYLEAKSKIILLSMELMGILQLKQLKLVD